MEGRNCSGSHSGGVVKNRSSSGCLIIKKKHGGVSGVGSSKCPKLYESKKEKKRPRLSPNDLLSSEEEELQYYRKRGVAGINQVSGGGGGASLVYEDNGFEDMGFGRNVLMREGGPKRSKLDVYDFDEYDDLGDVEMLRMRHYHERGLGGRERRFLGAMPVLKGGSGVEFESGSSKGDIIYKRRNSFNGGSSSEKFKSGRFEMRNELPVSMGKEKLGGSDEAIRLQGKNGVLKVRVKHKEEISEQLSQNYVLVKGNNVVPRSLELTPKNSVVRRSLYSGKNMPKKPIAVDRLDKKKQRNCKPLSTESSEESDEEAEDSDSSPKLQADNVQVHRSIKRGRNGGSMQSPQNSLPVKLKEGKVKRGSGTEKQLLREKIRNMLISAGWTIDYRPRRGRDYFDAVYVNPTGTAYWSIIKAYDALQKQLEEEGNRLKASEECSSFAPISEDVLSKLTRQTRKKIEKELKRKKREEAGGKRKKEFRSGNFEEDESDTDSGGSVRRDDKLSSYMKHSGKSLKVASKESYRDGSNSNSKMPERGERSSAMSNSRLLHARKSKKIGRCTLLVRNSDKGLDSESDGFIPYTGRRNLLSWLIDSGTVKLSEKVHYMNRRCTRVMLEGWITREGIHCGCCSKILTVSKFEIHAASKLRQPYQNIYLSSGASLMQCQIDAWNKQEESLRNGCNNIDVNGDDPNDDTCAICGDGGNLICCDSCPSTFHQNCVGIEMLPPGDWHCPHCSCKFCGLADMSVTEGNDKRQDSVLTCSLCEGKFHGSCAEEVCGTTTNSNSPPFCGKTCQELSEQLQKLLGVKHELEGGLAWSLIYRTDIGSDTSVRGFPQRVEWNSKLAVALNVMDECFLPIVDRRSGINMIHSVLYNSGSNITRLSYSGFYTAILEKGDEIISAASIRIRGNQFSEMPFIGTRHIYRRQGMCRQLFSAIESALRSLNVEKMIIPAISELMDTWTTVFGFNTLEESDKHGMKVGNMLVFPGTDMLQKKLLDQDKAKRGSVGLSSHENGHSASDMASVRKKSDLHFSPGLCSAAEESENEDMKDESCTDFNTQDMVGADENFLHSASAECCEEVKPSLPTENEGIKDMPVADFGSRDMIDADETFLQSASADRCEEFNPSLPTDNEEMKDVFVADIGSQDMVGADETLHSASTDRCEEFKPSFPTENEEMKAVSVADFGSQDMVGTDENLLHSVSADCSEEVKPSLPTENEEMKDVFVADFSSQVMVGANENFLHSASPDCCEEVKPSLPSENEELKGVPVADFGSQDIACTDKISLYNASVDCCKEVKPSLPNDNEETKNKNVTDFGFHGMVCTDNNFLQSAADCCGKFKPSLCTASSRYSSDNKPSLLTASAAVSNKVKPLVPNEGSLGTTSAELQSGTKFNESAADVKDHVSVVASTDTQTGNILDDSAASHIVGVTVNVKLTEAANIVAEPRSLPADTSDNGILNGFLTNDTENQRGGILPSENESAAYGKHHSLPESFHVDVMEKPVIQSPAESDLCSGSQSLYVSDKTDLDAAQSKICITRNDMACSQIIETMLVDKAYESSQNASQSTVAIVGPQPDYYGGITGQPTLECEVQHVEVTNVQPISNVSCEVSVNTVEANTCSEDVPSVSDDHSIGVSGSLPVPELHDQATM